MPLYEYSCRDCGRRFEALVFGSERPGCPACGGRKLEKLLSTFAVGGASAGAAGFDTGGEAGSDADGDPAGGGCGSCGDPRGPGACGSET
jgi:putative FmdB family regulatory protein